ncbi:MAG TPA: ankyrin repeat domain-containing protein [Phycisphaerae bacterium]|nr:ankyrin repeat domain-containing protein [Phycisphaerae bacterium]
MNTRLIGSIFLVFATVCPSSAFADDTDDLPVAAYRGDLNRVRSLLSAGADVNAKATAGVTALWQAAANGHTEIVKALLESKANVNVQRKTDSSTPLFVAAVYGHADIVKVLLEAAADVNAKVHAAGEDHTPLSIATQRGHTEVIKLLTEYGAKD